MTAVARRDTGDVPRPSEGYVRALQDTARGLRDEATAPSTRQAYASAWKAFTRWCGGMGLTPLPAEESTLVGYVAHLENLAMSHSTVSRHLSAIRWHHAETGADLQTGVHLKRVTTGHVRRHGRAAEQKATGLRVTHLRRIVAVLDPTRPLDVRDRAIILLGFTGGFRRSELAALAVANVTDHEDGLQVLVRRSKADQEGRGLTKAIPCGANPGTCPVAAYRAWIAMSGITTGRVFRAVRKNGVVWGDGVTDQVIAKVVHARAAAVGLPGKWSGHSLRRGFATESAAAGVPRHQIMHDGGWKSAAVDEYIEAGAKFTDRAASRLGL